MSLSNLTSSMEMKTEIKTLCGELSESTSSDVLVNIQIWMGSHEQPQEWHEPS